MLDFDSEPQEAVKKYLEEAQPTLQLKRSPQANGDPTIVEGSLKVEETEKGNIIVVQVVSFHLCLSEKNTL